MPCAAHLHENKVSVALVETSRLDSTLGHTAEAHLMQGVVFLLTPLIGL